MPIKVAAAPATKRVVYDTFKGVDFSTDEILVDRSRSPYAVNMISDKGGQPEKRAGWEVVHTYSGSIYGGQINGLAHGEIDGVRYLLVHAGKGFYVAEYDKKYGSSTEFVGYISSRTDKSEIFFADHGTKTKAFVLTGNEFLFFDGTDLGDVSSIATIPVFMIAKSPKGNDGTMLEPLNLLQPGFTEQFIGDKESVDYQLSFGELDETEVKVQVMNSNGVFEDKTEGTDFTVDRTGGIVTFTTAPGESPLTGEDNVKITAYRTVEGYAERITGCRSWSLFGVGGNNRVFLTRNKLPQYKAYDWHSELNDPTYFPDTNYAVIGNNNTAVMGYAKLGENQLIIKEDNQQDTTIFSRAAQYLDTEASFPVKIGITGIGAVSPYSFGALVDEPLFLARNGVYAITSNAITYEKTLQNRSFFVDAKLTKEQGLENATAVVWNNYYLLSVNSRVYLLDARQKSYNRENPNGFVYECFYWENVDARCWLTYDGELYFGDSKGRLCRFKTEADGVLRYNDNGEAITAVWSTKLDDDDAPEMLKTMQKKGCVVTIKPFSRNYVDVAIKTSNDAVPITAIKDVSGVFDFGDIGFEGITFESNTNARPVVIKHKVKKYKALQFVLKNDRLNQGFGVFNVVKTYTVVNYAKG